MSRPRTVSTPTHIASYPRDLIEDLIAVGWDTVDSLSFSHPLRTPLIFAVWALEDAIDAEACTSVAAPIVVGLVARLS